VYFKAEDEEIRHRLLKFIRDYWSAHRGV